MRLKSYFAGTVEAAMASARQELGPEAMLMNSRKAPAEARHLGEYEVVFATLPDLPAAETDFAPATTSNQPAPWNQLSGEVSQLRRQIEQMSSGIGRAVSLAGALAACPELSQTMAALIELGIDAPLAHRILDGVRTRQEFGTAGNPRDLLTAEIESMVHIDATAGRAGQSARVVALIGPPGAGKTTTLVKIAIREGLRARRRTHFISTDVERIGGAEQLRSYAAILGTGFQVVESAAALGPALDEQDGKDLVLIDTPGYGARDLNAAAELANAFTLRPEIDVHLVLPASMRPADLGRICERFEIFRPAKLIFTRIDEVESSGAILSAAARAEKPVSFLCSGQQVPEDMEPAAIERILEITIPAQLLSDARQKAPAAWRRSGAAA